MMVAQRLTKDDPMRAAQPMLPAQQEIAHSSPARDLQDILQARVTQATPPEESARHGWSPRRKLGALLLATGLLWGVLIGAAIAILRIAG
ncbi:hypothetical protein CLG96_14340 [Sphingomonas oleivorans]|uniref:Uncharacterized protein n=1 Tax=Sphingomonas oleivorans TaxID=1735121 RepID=A0A2T5FVA1_9SPHN|nr:hypothetical protein [Sphingomonas oleivorans]PTQ09383.1 hypothetical protein CLG96_14340 [Sphingomonas oleivorans]